MKIKVTGAYGESNFGDDLLMSVFENYFLTEFPNSELYFNGEKNTYVQYILKKAKYGKRNINQDWLVFGGGTQFFSFKNESEVSFFDKLKHVIKNPQVIINKLKKDEDCRLSFLGFGMGPFTNNLKMINYSKSKLVKADFVGVRDSVSQNYCKEWGLDSVLGADVVFSSYFKLPKLQLECKKEGDKSIGIIVRDWNWEDSGNAYIDKIINYHNANKNHTKFIILAPKKDQEIIRKVGLENCLIWNPNKDTIESFLSKLNEYDALITSRYHGAIVFALMGKPVICIEIEDKLKILTQQIPELLFWNKPFDETKLTELIARLDYNVNYKNSLKKLRTQADFMLNEFKKTAQKL